MASGTAEGEGEGEGRATGRPLSAWSGNGIWRVISLAAFLALWQGAALIVAKPTLPGPQAVWAVIVSETLHGDLLLHMRATLLRVAAAFVVAMSIGSVCGIAMGRHPLVNRIADTWLVMLLNTPALVIAVLAYVWFGLNEWAAVGAVALNKIPSVMVTLREGARALDPKLDDMATCFRFSYWTRLRHVILPQLTPYLAASSRAGLALIWKVVLMVELLGRSNGVGFAIHLNFENFDVAAILAYSVTFAAVMLALEYGVVQPFETRASRWRGRHG